MPSSLFTAILTFIIWTLSIFPAAFTNPQPVRPATPTLSPSNGVIEYKNRSLKNSPSLTVILRGLTLSAVNPKQNISRFVDWYVGNYTFGHSMIVVLGDFHIGGILQYPLQFNSTHGTWPGTGWTLNQLETLTEQFHAHGWKVWWGGTAIAWNGQWEYNYITQQHPELAFCDANGYRANNINGGDPAGNTPGNKTVGYNCLIPDFWAKYATADTALNISAGLRLIDVISTRLGQIIAAGLTFDGWYPSDGWNGFNMQGYNFPGGTNPARSYSFSLQEESEWATDSVSGFGLSSIGQPSGWNSWNMTQRANWVLNSKTASTAWHEWWCYRFSKMYLQIKNAIVDNNPSHQDFYTMIGADGSDQWTSGNLGGAGLLNFTMVANDQSIDRFVVDPENIWYATPKYSEMPKEDAYVAGLVRSKDVRLTPLIGIQETSWYDKQTAVPEWNLKQQYLAQVQNYVWFNGVRYPACNTTNFCLQYPPAKPPSGEDIDWATSSWNNTAVHNLFNWIDSLQSLYTDATPLYLGPTQVNPYIYDGWSGNPCVEGINYTIAQWADIVNLHESASYINSEMGTIYLDEINLAESSPNRLSQDQEDEILQMFTGNLLNIIVGYGNGAGIPYAFISSMFSKGNEALTQTTLGLTYSAGTANSAAILSSSQISDPYANSIVSNYYGTSWTIYNRWYGEYTNPSPSSFVPIAEYSDGTIALGIKYGAATGRFLYMNNWCQPGGTQVTNNYQQLIPTQVINSAIYWASDSPIISSNSLLDYKVFMAADGSIFIPAMNHNCTSYSSANGQPVFSTLQIDPQSLGLGNILDYDIYWQSNPSTLLHAFSWNNVPVTLLNMADVLVITPK